jgi:hypothetical protein
MWTGTTNAESHDAVLASIILGVSLEKCTRVTRTELNRYLSAQPDTQLLVLSEKGRRRGTKMIPYDEVGARGRYELDQGKPVAIDCSTGGEPWMCQEAGLMLAKWNFKNVMLVDLKQRGESCEN